MTDAPLPLAEQITVIGNYIQLAEIVERSFPDGMAPKSLYALRNVLATLQQHESARAALLKAQKEAVIAWSVCASIHREFGNGRDALYTTRQADFVKHEAEARTALDAAANTTGDAVTTERRK